MALSAADVRVTEKEFYFDNPYPVYRALREERPVYWHETGKFWILTKYKDIESVSKDAETFSSGSGILLTDVLNSSDFLSQMYPDGAENVSTSDPPRHTQIRSHMNFAFARQRIASFEPRIRALVIECLDKIPSAQPVDVVKALSIPVTANVIKAFIDCEDMTLDQVVGWSDEVFKMGTDMSFEDFLATVERVKPMFEYFAGKIAEGRKSPKDDFIGHLIASETGDEAQSTAMVQSHCQTVMVAGNETTRNAFSATIRLFAEHPDQYDLLRARPELVDSAVEEILRYHAPAIGFLRTATRDTEISGTKVSKGEHVYLVYGAANRDPEMFEDPERFDITRFLGKPPSHLTFGRGPHICIGMALNRLEMQVLLQEMVTRFVRMEMAGEPVRPNTLLGNGYVALPARFYHS